VTLAEVPPSPRLDAMLRRRITLGLDCSLGSLLLLDEHGAPRSRYARSVRLSMEGNAGFCRGLLRTRYLNRSS
jgi:hypothetical protein